MLYGLLLSHGVWVINTIYKLTLSKLILYNQKVNKDWDFWKVTRDTDFIEWFEVEMFGGESKEWNNDGGYVPEGIKSSIRRD